MSDSLIDPGGVSWGRDGYIYTDARLEGDGFARVHEDGGRPEVVTTPTVGENWHSVPNALPNGKGVLFYVDGPDRIDVVDPESGERTPLVEGVWGGYAGSGHLIWVTREGILMAQPFDPESFELDGRPTPLVEGVLRPPSLGGANVAISDSGDLVYLTGRPGIGETTLVWVDRSGAATEFDPEWVRPFRRLALSPDGSQVAVSLREADSDHSWVKATAGGPARKLTFEASNQDPVWLPGGEWVGYVSTQRGESGIYKRRADGTGGEVLVAARNGVGVRRPTWSPDGRWLIYESTGTLMGQPLGADGDPDGDAVVLVDDSAGSDGLAAISPDGRWIAFTSGRAGPATVIVRPFPETDGGSWSITEGPSAAPSWSSDGTELFFRLGDGFRRVGRVGVRAGQTFGHTSQETLFDAARLDLDGGDFGSFSPMPEGDRFLMIRSAASAEDQGLVLVQNFFEVLRERVGN